MHISCKKNAQITSVLITASCHGHGGFVPVTCWRSNSFF